MLTAMPARPRSPRPAHRRRPYKPVTDAAPLTYDASDTAFVAGLLGPGYEVQRLLGRGAVSCTHLVREVESGRPMVARVLHREITQDDTARAHIRRLTRAGLTLAHPNIVRTFAMAGDDEPVPYAICEFVEGSDLATLIRHEGRLPEERAVRIAHDIASALEAAHAKGLVHGSLRPTDVLVDGATGHARVYEFDSPLFGDFGFLGNPKYAAPEQLQDPGSGPRAPADVFALGAILFEMLTGADPFPADSTMQQMVRKLERPPIPLRKLRPDVSEPLEPLLARLMAAEPRKRATASEAREALEASVPPAPIAQPQGEPLAVLEARRLPPRFAGE